MAVERATMAEAMAKLSEHISKQGGGLVPEFTEPAAPEGEPAPEPEATEAGAEDAYTGDPTAASREDGDGYFEALGEIFSLSVMEHLGSKS